MDDIRHQMQPRSSLPGTLRPFACLGLTRSMLLTARVHCANVCSMSVQLSPIVSEFETEGQQASYNQWFRAKVEEALLSKKPRLPHDAAMAKVHAMLEERRKVRADRSLI